MFCGLSVVLLTMMMCCFVFMQEMFIPEPVKNVFWLSEHQIWYDGLSALVVCVRGRGRESQILKNRIMGRMNAMKDVS